MCFILRTSRHYLELVEELERKIHCVCFAQVRFDAIIKGDVINDLIMKSTTATLRPPGHVPVALQGAHQGVGDEGQCTCKSVSASHLKSPGGYVEKQKTQLMKLNIQGTDSLAFELLQSKTKHLGKVRFSFSYENKPTDSSIQSLESSVLPLIFRLHIIRGFFRFPFLFVRFWLQSTVARWNCH
ncbi:hypothetical protein B0H12DRAFT_274503 [Mycena haematopus]|nr:hypothetical protein B0H12DRAFT_274503 [Mycena haematopus]